MRLCRPTNAWFRFVPTISLRLPADDDKARTSAAAAAGGGGGGGREMMMLVLLIPLRCIGSSIHSGYFVSLHGISHQMLSSRCYTLSVGLSVPLPVCMPVYIMYVRVYACVCVSFSFSKF